MQMILASDPLTTLGQVSAIIMLIFMLISTLVSMALVVALLFGISWLREKVKLVKQLRPVVDSVNANSQAAAKGALPAPTGNENAAEKVARATAQVPAYARSIEEKVEQGSDRVAGAVIEFRARTVMVKGTLKALFLPGLNNRPKRARLPGARNISALEEGQRDDAAAKIAEPPALRAIAAPDSAGQPVAASNAPKA